MFYTTSNFFVALNVIFSLQNNIKYANYNNKFY